MSQNSRLDFLRLLITIFGFFFGGWWTIFLSDVFSSSNVPLVNKCFVTLHILMIFISFYLVPFIDRWKVLPINFALFDLGIASIMLSLFSPKPMIPGEPFIWKLLMAMTSLGILQFLTVHYSKLSQSGKKRTNDSTVGKPRVV